MINYKANIKSCLYRSDVKLITGTPFIKVNNINTETLIKGLRKLEVI